MNFKKPKSLVWMKKETWESLSLREQAYFIASREQRHTEKEIQHKLLFDTYEGYWRMKQRAIKKTRQDLQEYHCKSQCLD